ncbi:protein kinase [Parvularcula sp. ZS-1/3]|uniref:Protein kinase n=1 Tax=Parvularcula mediterranea TaxID=2732508 RepID=A0A7Y3RJD0_9PROT|nr:protein kinase [Parvularcula mediterranea]NNU15148.1 protein kinase [Parvularcula mediterranea]
MDSSERERQALDILDLALQQPEAEQEAFVRNLDVVPEDVRNRVLELLGWREESGTDIKTAGALIDEAGEGAVSAPAQLKAWKLTGMIGQGGMGAVYKGERWIGDFDQTVAIKLLRRLSPTLAERLRAERQTLARLSHPNIRQLFDGGETEDGRPYIVMEYLEGQPLHVLFEGRDVQLEERLDFYDAVLDAIQYAHRFGVAHGDLSPANILVTDEGVLKVIDFGISETLAEEPAEESPSLGTAGFVAPEREAGRPGGVPGDIYSLGKLLAFITDDMDAPRPSDLGAIIDKATREEPSQRYASASSLREDFHRYREARAVEASDPSALLRFSRFAGRHPLSIGSSFAGALVLIAALAIISTLFVRAQTAEAEAIRRYDAVRSLARSVLFDVYDELKGIPRTEDAKQLVTELGQQYLNDLETDPRADASLRREVAEGYVQLGSILGDSNKDFFYDPDRAKELWTEADARLTAILSEEPQNREALLALARLRQLQGQTAYIAESDREGGKALYQEAETLFTRAREAGPLPEEHLVSLLMTKRTIADIDFREGARDEATTKMEETFATLGEEIPEDGLTPALLSTRSNMLRTRARQSILKGETESAIADLDAALADLVHAEEQGKETAETLRSRSIIHWRRAYAYHQLGQSEKSIEDYEQAIALNDRRLAIEPDSEDAQYNDRSWSAELSLPLGAVGRFEEAAAALEPAGRWYEARHAEAPDDARYQRNLLVHHFQISELHRQSGDAEARCGELAAALSYADMMEASGALANEDAQALEPFRQQLAACES